MIPFTLEVFRRNLILYPFRVHLSYIAACFLSDVLLFSPGRGHRMGKEGGRKSDTGVGTYACIVDEAF